MSIVGIDLGNTMGVAEYKNGIIKSFTLRGVTIKNIIKKLMEVLTENPKIITALPNIYGRFRYNVIISQSKKCGVLEHNYPTVIIKENTANKAIIGKGRPTKEEIMEEITKLGFHPKTHDEADAIKFLLYYLNNNGITYKAE